MKSICVIPARAASKRIKNKNLIDFRGKSLISWTLQAAIESKKYDRIIVSTDSPEIAHIAEKDGIEVPFMRDKYADDSSHVSLATLHALEQSEKYFGEQYENITQLMPNCPFRSSETIKDFHDTYLSENTETLLSCMDFGWLKPWWAFSLDENNKAQFLFPEKMSLRSQELESLYTVSGAIWITRPNVLKKYKTFYTPNAQFLPISSLAAADIDTYNDLSFAKNLS
tara:strand:- start:97 stop:774 length:678 start_codon:yes stop_codon:yes gene_type:complete